MKVTYTACLVAVLAVGVAYTTVDAAPLLPQSDSSDGLQAGLPISRVDVLVPKVDNLNLNQRQIFSPMGRHGDNQDTPFSIGDEDLTPEDANLFADFDSESGYFEQKTYGMDQVGDSDSRILQQDVKDFKKTGDGYESPASAESTTPLPIDMARTDGGIDLPQDVASKHGEVDHVYIINLKSRTDRRDLMSILMQYAGLDVEFFPGTTPDMLGLVPGKEQRPKSLSGAQLACWRSHMNVYQDIVTKGYRHALILEDDVDLEANTKDLLVEMIPRLPKDWDLFYAGRCGAVNTKDRVDNQSPSLLKFYKMGCTHGYMVSLRGARRLLYLLQKPTDAIDMMTLSPAEHHSLQAFTTEPPWIAQVRRPDDPTNIPSSAAGRMWEGLRNSTRVVALANLGLS
ncbi:hypothetical protein H4R35_002959 [Dimargaris xerosporica]|nr:hypothetical protein H4R35_002959 [Dimargaris xerosporica]